MPKEIHRFNGRIMALGRFLSRLVDRYLPFYDILCGAKRFTWTSAYMATFTELKPFLYQLLAQAKPDVGDTLYVYLAANYQTISTVFCEGSCTKLTPCLLH